jgi:hypothetical protein
MKPLERDRRRGGRSRYRTASTDRASRPIDLPQQMVGWDMVFQAAFVFDSSGPVSDPTLSTPAASLRLTRDKDRAFRENFTFLEACQ